MANGLSLDLNTKETGFVEWFNDVPVKWGVVKPARVYAELDYPNWLGMSKAIRIEFVGMKWDWVAMEGVYIGNNSQSALTIAMLTGSVAGDFGNRSTPFLILPTATIDAACGITSKGRKDHTLALAKLGLRGKMRGGETVKLTQDIADAYCVGIAAWGKYQEHVHSFASSR